MGHSTAVDRIDPTTGRTVRQLTTWGSFQHLYFTSPSFTADGRAIVLIGDVDGSPNLFRLERGDGTLTRVTNNRAGLQLTYEYIDGRPGTGFAKPAATYCQATDQALYVVGREVRLVDVASGEDAILHVLPQGFAPGYTHLSRDGRLACIPVVPVAALSTDPAAYFARTRDAFRERRLESRVVVLDTATGHVTDSFGVRAWVTHVQFHPQRNDRILYNHEGGWPPGAVDQRIWMRRDGMSVKVRDESPDRAREVFTTHENWTSGGLVAYHGSLRRGDRREGMVGLADPTAGTHAECFFPVEEADDVQPHFIAGSGELLVADGGIEDGAIVLVGCDWERGELRSQPLCRHASSWANQDVHPHPVFSPDDRQVLFTSDAHNERGRGHVYIVDAEWRE
jgi:oligogalacturonide lyase